MRPRLVAFHEGALYARLARVLAQSAAEHCPEWDRRIEARQLFDDGEQTVNERVRHSNRKLAQWAAAVDAAPDGTPMLLIDADCLILRPLDDVWAQPFDVAYTIRDPKRSRLPHNAGVVFVRATPAARAFLWAWLEATVPIRASRKLIARARLHFGACDQAGLAVVLREPEAQAATIRALTCLEWNCEDSEWGRFDPSLTRIVHIKGALRDALLKPRPVISRQRWAELPPLMQRWRAVDAAVTP